MLQRALAQPLRLMKQLVVDAWCMSNAQIITVLALASWLPVLVALRLFGIV
jgi:hypothetical protein